MSAPSVSQHEIYLIKAIREALKNPQPAGPLKTATHIVKALKSEGYQIAGPSEAVVPVEQIRKWRGLAAQWCSYQGNTDDLHNKYLTPFDAIPGVNPDKEQLARVLSDALAAA